MHNFYGKRKSPKNEIRKKALDFLRAHVSPSDGQFRRMYRLSKVAFQQLVTIIREHRQRAGRRPGRHAVDAKLSMRRFYVTNVGRPLPGDILGNWSSLLAHVRISFYHCVYAETPRKGTVAGVEQDSGGGEVMCAE
jgi:hypothetical protein